MSSASADHDGYAPPIYIPERHIKNLRSATNFAIDIGGSLAKLAYFSNVPGRRRTISQEGTATSTKDEEFKRSRLHFVKFETKHIRSLANFIKSCMKDTLDICKGRTIKVTGGGAFKYTDIFQEVLGLIPVREDEMECLIKGCNFLLNNIPNEAFTFKKNGAPEIGFQSTGCEYPYLLVNIGSGVSILKVEGEDKFERVGGTAMGGGTFWGLGSLLTKARGFDELLQLAEKGEPKNVDLLVQDIYGSGYEKIGLPGDLIASSFGKAARTKNQGPAHDAVSEEDIAKSLLIMISNDIGQIAYLQSQVHGVNKIIFGGFFIRGQKTTMHTITYAINYWSKGKTTALFLRHEGYLGAVGAYLKGTETEALIGNYGENFAFSDGLELTDMVTKAISSLELELLDLPLVPFPLVNMNTYEADLFNLTLDTEARNYWLEIFHSGLDRFCKVIRAGESNRDNLDKRIDLFKSKFLACLSLLRGNPYAYGNLSVRTLLDCREQFLDEFDFYDPYLHFKKEENAEAMSLLEGRLKKLSMLNWEDRQINSIKGILGGNLFDWGSSAVVKMNDDHKINFEDACKVVQERPWAVDNLDEWIARIKKEPYNKIVIFVDNSGADIVLGILPFVVEMLMLGSKVVLSANSRPALNDVTSQELRILAAEAAGISLVIKDGLETGKLRIVESGLGSPCLDLSRVSQQIADASSDCDLVIVEGMGRAIHTNCTNHFLVDSLRLCVLKNSWLCKKFDCPMFSGICKFEVADEEARTPTEVGSPTDGGSLIELSQKLQDPQALITAAVEEVGALVEAIKVEDLD